MFFRRLLPALMLLALVWQPAQAQSGGSLAVQPIVLRHIGEQVNIRVEVRNLTGEAVHAPYQIRLLARPNSHSPWHSLRNWDEQNLPAGQLVARDYLPVPPVDPSLVRRHPQVRVEVWVNGQLASATEQTVGHSEAP